MTNTTRTLDYGERGTVLVVPDGEALAQSAAELVVATVDAAAANDRKALVALSGGSTPRQMGKYFAAGPMLGRISWDNLHVFWGDERWVPLDDPESNAGEAMRGFLDHVPIPGDQVHPFVTEGIEPETSARNLEHIIKILDPGSEIPRFDLILLGMGDDGHTASLFPGTMAIHETDRLVFSHHVDKLNAMRLTFTPSLINAAKKVAFLVGGAGKAGMLANVLDGPIDIDHLPSQVVRPGNGDVTWIVDEAAAARLERNANHG